MKVLEYGEGYPKTIVCNECKSTLEYAVADIEETTKRKYNPDPFIEYVEYIDKYLVCPVCNHPITLNLIYCLTKYKEIPSKEPEPKKKKWWQKNA